MTPTTYNPEPGSPADRVLDLLARNPAEDYTSSDLALKFQVPKGRWDVLLAEPVAKGLVHRGKSPGDTNVIWCAGAGLLAWAAQRKDGAASAGGLAPASAPAVKRKAVAKLAAPDLAKLQVEVGVPVAARTVARAGQSKWDPLFALLTKPDTSVALPVAYQSTVYTYMRKAKKAGLLQGTFIVRRCAINKAQCRVWRTA